MTRMATAGRWGVLLALLVPDPVSAGGGSHVDRSPDCPPNLYSRLNYWAPGVWRYRAHHEAPGPYLYPAPVGCPPVEPRPVILGTPCRAVDPATIPYGDLRPLRQP